jgi:hypothetical protein
MPRVSDTAADPELLARTPRETLQRLLDREVGRLESRRGELAAARTALLRLAGGCDTGGPGRQDPPAWEPLSTDMVPAVLDHLLQAADGPVRACARSLERQQTTLAEHCDRALYPLRVLEGAAGRRRLQELARGGVQQRLVDDPPSDFTVFGQAAVLASATWGDPSGGFVLVREPMAVQAFGALFDLAYGAGLPLPVAVAAGSQDARLLALMGRGLKDEAISRYLGWSLRTVRRRVATVMDGLGAETRFQLGAAAQRAGLLGPGPGA